jgi:hypothetical protein
MPHRSITFGMLGSGGKTSSITSRSLATIPQWLAKKPFPKMPVVANPVGLRAGFGAVVGAAPNVEIPLRLCELINCNRVAVAFLAPKLVIPDKVFPRLNFLTQFRLSNYIGSSSIEWRHRIRN